MRLRLATSATGVALAAFACGAAASAQPVPTAPQALEACRLQPAAAPLGPGGLRDCFYQAAFLASRAARHLVSFETRTDTNPETAASFAAAAAVTSEVLANIAGRPGGKAALARIAEVAIAQADEPSASLSGGVLTIAIVPARGAAGRPSADQIERALQTP